MKLFSFLLLLFAACCAKAQPDSIRIAPAVRLPKDTLERTLLLHSLQVFLSAAQSGLTDTLHLFILEKPETQILLDEVAGTDSKGKQLHYYKPYLTNVVALPYSTYYLQLSYVGISESAAELNTSFAFIAHQIAEDFYFSSPLLYNTRYWKTEKRGNNIFHYPGNLNQEKAADLDKLTQLYDAKLKLTNKTTDYYCCDNLLAAQQLIGIDYKLDYNGLAEGTLSTTTGNRKLVVLGDNSADLNHFDPHDLWHDRLSLATDRSKTNRPVDEGIAYLYGGSWGLPWKQIFKAFTEQVASNPATDWAALKETPVRFKTGKYNNQADYIVNALLVQKIEKERGFAGVWELLTVGPSEKGNVAYYQTLEKLTGITKDTYNSKVWELVRAEK